MNFAMKNMAGMMEDFECKAAVGDLKGPDILLGLDWLHFYKAMVCFASMRMYVAADPYEDRINEKRRTAIELKIDPELQSLGSALTLVDVTGKELIENYASVLQERIIEPFTSKRIRVKSRNRTKKGIPHLFEASAGGVGTGHEMCDCLIEVDNSRSEFFVVVSNHSHEELILPKNHVVGKLSDLQEVKAEKKTRNDLSLIHI